MKLVFYEHQQPSMVRCGHTRDPAQEYGHVEKPKLAQAAENGSERAHPGVVDPFPQWGVAGPRFQISPMSKDHVDPGADLHIAQLFVLRTIGTTWPRIHPHGSQPLVEWLNFAVEKGL
jgi:hypothetical protein